MAVACVAVPAPKEPHRAATAPTVAGAGSDQRLTPAASGYADVNGLKMYYEIRGQGEPVVMLHGAFMAITDEWTDWVNELAKTRKVIATIPTDDGPWGLAIR